ncbi:MAG TPA: beta-propeller fold lactonase family protein [Solirubrobacteraceae bacterium]|nr:beta-propeller fold lactonase family protein [Solirubrobacteraceae bacterium]
MFDHQHSTRRSLIGLAATLVSTLAAGLGAATAHAQTSVVVAENGAGNGAISTFALGGASTPIRRITGSLTGLASPEQIAADRSGNLYVANSSGSITVYPPTATGNVAPLRTIAGAATGLGGGVFGIAVDAAGHVYASNHYRNSITEYASGATGNVAPIATLAGPATGVQLPTGIALDPAGHLWVDNAAGITEYAAGASGNAAPIAAIAGPQVSSSSVIAFDAAGHLFVNENRPGPPSSFEYTVEEFAAGATGSPAPIATLHGPDTGLNGPSGLGFVPGATEQLLVGNLFGAGSVTQYGVPADGDLKPSATPVASGAVSSPTGLLVVSPPTLTSPSQLHGMAGAAFSQTLTGGGGHGPYSWAISSGSLPAGLKLNAATGAITGIPSTAGTTSFTVRLTDQSLPTAQTATATISIAIDPAIVPAVYVANGGNGTVTSYAIGGSGNLAPLTTFGRTGFGLNAPAGLTIAPSGRVYVANSGNDSVTSYAPGAAAPSVTNLTGPATALQGPSAATLDASGRLYVADQPANAVTVYAPGATGNATPVATITGPDTGISGPDALAIDTAGRLWVADSGSNSLTQYAPGANGDAKPLVTIAGSATGLNTPRGLSQDAAGDLLVTNQYGHTVTVYAPGTSGNAFPKATLGGSSTMLSFPTGIDVDTQGRVYVANQYDNDIHVYAPGAAANSAPIATITGNATGLSGPGAVAVTPPLSILTGHLPHAVAQRRYRARLSAGEGRTPYRWSIARGALPAGLRLTRSGIIDGRARHAGRARVLIKVSDAERPAAHATTWLTLVVRRARHHSS